MEGDAMELEKKRIAVVGAGISGLFSAYLLSKKHDVVVYEAESRLGGHTATTSLEIDGRIYNVDSAFITFNEDTYPNFSRLLKNLDVEIQPNEMTVSVSCKKDNFEYKGDNIDTMFVQRSNIFSLSYFWMLAEIIRFNWQAKRHLRQNTVTNSLSLHEYLVSQGYSQRFIEQFIVPMGIAVWTGSVESLKNTPAYFFLRFWDDHGLLTVNDRPQWMVIKGGSAEYIPKLIAGFKDKIRLNTPVTSIRRKQNKVLIKSNGNTEEFDCVVLATHADQALTLLEDPSDKERDILGAFHSQVNEATIHQDVQLLPKRIRAWSNWNIHLPQNAKALGTLTYDMNAIQGLGCPKPILVSLNMSDKIDSSKVLKTLYFRHPIFSKQSVEAQQRIDEINKDGTFFCGAYWGRGFHEDGVVSAIGVAKKFGITFD